MDGAPAGLSPPSDRRDLVIDALADAVSALRRPHPVRVAVDGVSVAGKTILADELVAPIERRGRTVIRTGIDGFHRPSRERYRLGRDSPEGYLRDSFDRRAVIESILEPLGPHGDLEYREAVFDFRTDSPVAAATRVAASDAVLVFDGVFLLVPELRGFWDFAIFVHADFETTLARALSRDLPLFGSETEIRRRYRVRYIPGERLYLGRHRPQERADVVVLNDDPDAPSLVWRPREGDSLDPGDRSV